MWDIRMDDIMGCICIYYNATPSWVRKALIGNVKLNDFEHYYEGNMSQETTFLSIHSLKQYGTATESTWAVYSYVSWRSHRPLIPPIVAMAWIISLSIVWVWPTIVGHGLSVRIILSAGNGIADIWAIVTTVQVDVLQRYSSLDLELRREELGGYVLVRISQERHIS